MAGRVNWRRSIRALKDKTVQAVRRLIAFVIGLALSLHNIAGDVRDGDGEKQNTPSAECRSPGPLPLAAKCSEHDANGYAKTRDRRNGIKQLAAFEILAIRTGRNAVNSPTMRG